MTSRRIRWLTYWNFAKHAKRWPRKPERRIINVIAEQAVEMLNEPPSFYGFPVRVDDRLEPGRVLVIDPCTCTEPSCPRWKGMVRDVKGFWRKPTELEIHEATLCGCGHGDYRTCPCEPRHPSKATGQFDHID